MTLDLDALGAAVAKMTAAPWEVDPRHSDDDIVSSEGVDVFLGATRRGEGGVTYERKILTTGNVEDDYDEDPWTLDDPNESAAWKEICANARGVALLRNSADMLLTAARERDELRAALLALADAADTMPYIRERAYLTSPGVDLQMAVSKARQLLSPRAEGGGDGKVSK